MKPVIVIVGRPNVGKSTLFNRLTRSRDALVADFPGLTRDRHYGEGRTGGRSYFIVDTGGFEPIAKEGIAYEMARQTELAVFESDLVIFLVDARSGLNYEDKSIANFLRTSGRPVLVVANKAEGMNSWLAFNTSDFYELGLGEVLSISASHGDGITSLMEQVFTILPHHRNKDSITQSQSIDDLNFSQEESLVESSVKIAVVGRPNVGKSTLINALIGEDRLVAFDKPGTTRDTIRVDFNYRDKCYCLFDTAGLRKKGKVIDVIEKFSVIKTLQAIEHAHVVILLLDAQQNIGEQDAHIAGLIVEQGRGLVVAINKCDGVDEYQKIRIFDEVKRKLVFLDFAKIHAISAKKQIGFQKLIDFVDEAYQAAMSTLSTPKLTRALIAATTHQAPQRRGSIRPKLRYAHQGGRNPPIVVVHGNALDAVSVSYRRYLTRYFRETFKLVGTPLRVQFRSNKNPYLSIK